jgi:SAM-dependent methyltransferase
MATGASSARRRAAAPLQQRRPPRGDWRERLAPPFERLLEDAVGGVDRILDVGCGENSPLARFERRPGYAVGIDIFPRALDRARAARTHDELRRMNVLDIERTFEPGSFEACVAFDLLEHLPEDDGRRVLSMMERVASRRVVIFTPNGFLPQEATEGNPFQVHRSGWSAARLAEAGYRVYGANGLRWLRGHKGSMRFRPRRAWGVASDLSQPLVARRPSLAFHLLAVKDLTATPS